MEERTYNAKGIISGFRQAAGYETIQAIADKLNISRVTYEKYEKKPWTMTLETLDKLEELFGEEFTDFFFKHKLYKQR